MRTANSILATALTATLARLDGAFDEPALVAFGPLSTDAHADVAEIVTRAVDEADCLEQPTVRLRELALHFRLPVTARTDVQGMKERTREALRLNARAMGPVRTWEGMQTAPRDGSPVLVACCGGPSTQARFVTDFGGGRDGWYAMDEEPGNGKPLHPDVWMDLPVAPAKRA